LAHPIATTAVLACLSFISKST